VAVLSASYRPAALAAKMATLLDVISGGRMVVGLGAGSHRAEHRAYGIPFASPAERTRRTLDALGVMRAMFREPAGASVAGLLENAPNLPGPVRPEGPPIWLAAHGPALLRAAGRHADGIVAAFAEPAEVARRLGVARETREPGSPPLACGLYTFVLPVPSIAEAHEWLMPEAQWLGTSPSALMRWLRTTGIVGTPQEVRERLHEQRLAGVTDAVLVLPSRVPADALDSLCETVLPPPAPGATGWARHAAAAAEVSPENNLVHLLVERHVAAGLADAPAVVQLGAGYDMLTLGDGGLQVTARDTEVIRGGAGADRITIAPGSGGAWIEGGGGNDTLTGGDGADTLFGGAGQDWLVGGAGADLFLYTAVSQSSAARPDTIVNFNPLEGDALVFVGIADGAGFRWRGAFAFTRDGGIEGRFDEATKTLRVDLDGDGEADMSWWLPGFPPEGFDGNAMIWA
jgi:hypothetical protein